MMGYVMEGTVYIDSVDFWGFVERHNENKYSIYEDSITYENKLYLDRITQELYVKTNQGIVVWFDMPAFWSFVLKYTPCMTAEYAFGVPKLDDFNLKVNFAASTEGHPSDWANNPACLKEWKLDDV